MSENAPIRMVHPDDAPVKVLLQYAGLSPADIPGESRIMTLAEVEAEVARRGITVSIPDPLPAPTREEADAFVFRMQRLGAHLLRLRPGSKKPVDEAWGDQPALTEAEAIEWLVSGGNLGVNLGRSNAIVLDPENAAATQFLMAAGLKPTVVTAKGEDPTSPKVGGRHVWIAVPEGVSADQLRSVLQIRLGEEGLIDVLAGSRFVVAPGSRLDEAPGYRYGFATGGALVDDGEWRVAPAWLFDASAAAPSVELEPLLGILAQRVRRERTPNPQSDAITEAIDQVSWDSWLASDPRVTIIGVDSACGCDVFHWYASGEARSGVLHDECQFGSGVHVFSGTLIAAWGREHGSRLQFAAWLHGVSEAEIAKRFDIDLGGRSLNFADQIDAAADVFEQRAADPVQCAGTVKRPDPKAVPQLVSLVDGVQTSRTAGEVAVPATEAFWRGESSGMRSLALLLRGDHHHPESVFVGADSVVGAPAPAQPQVAPMAEDEIVDAETVEEAAANTAPAGDAEVADETPAASSSPSTAPARDDAITGEIVEDWEDGDQQMWRRHRAIEAELRGERDPDTQLWIGMVPCLGRMANIAESRGIYMLGFIEACLPRVSARVPANVLLTPRADGIREKAEGVGMGYNSILLGPPATGKTTTQTAAAGAVPLPQGIRQCATGSAEGVIKKARSVGRDGEQKVHAVSVYVETDEIKSQLKDLKRDGSMYSAFINSAFFGGTMVGMAASEASRNADIPAHSTRFGQQIGAQPQLCGPLLDDAGSGLTARFSWAFTGSVDESALGPLYGRAVPALLPDGLPWDPPTGIPFGFRPYTGPAASDDEEAAPVYEIENIEALPAEWIVVPRDPEEVAAARAESARRSRRTRVALTEDRENGRTSGHDFVRIEKTAALLAFMDGIKQPTEEYAAAAKLLAEATALAAAEAKVQSDSEDEAKARRGGHLRGIEHLHGNAVAKQEGVDAVEAAADALYAKLTRPPEGVLVKGKTAKGFGGQTTYGELTAAKSVRPEHRPFREAGMALLIQQERITVSAVGTDRRTYVVTAVGAAGQLTAAPTIAGLSA